MALTNMEFYIIVPQAGENLVKNPRAVRSLTGYTSRGGAAITIDDTHVRRGSQCIRVGGQTGESGVFYSPFTLESGKTYTFSVDVFAPAGLGMALEIGNVAGTVTDVRKEFTATGNWQRVEVSYQKPVGSSSTNRRISVLKKASPSAEVFWVDGFQFEEGDKATTFIMGYEKGLGYIDNNREYWWDGLPYASSSKRSEYTRHGGRLVRVKDYARIISTLGLGQAPYNQVTTPIVTGGEIYQRHFRQSRDWGLVLVYNGNTIDEMMKNRAALLDAIRPDKTPYDQPLVVRAQGFDDDGNEVSDPIDIVSIPITSHTDLPQTSVYQKDVLMFRALDGQFLGAFRNGATLDYRVEFTANHLVRRDPQGVWVDAAGNNPMAGIAGALGVSKIVEAANGDIYAAGYFDSVSNDGAPVSNTTRIAKWSKDNQRWESLGAPPVGLIGEHIADMVLDAQGHIIFGGAGADAGPSKVVRYNPSTGNFTQLGGNPNSIVRALAISPIGELCIGGMFSQVADDTDCRRIAFYDPLANKWVSAATGLNSEVKTLKYTKSGKLLIGGEFTNANGSAGNYICWWDGTAFHSFTELGASELNGFVESIDELPDGRIIIGGYFTNAGGDPNANRIAQWNGTNWESVGGAGANERVMKIYCTPNGSTFAAGLFTKIGDVILADQVAMFKNGAWQSLEIDLPGSASITSILEATDKSLYLGGAFAGMASAPNPGEIEYKITASSGSANAYPEFTVIGPGKLDSITNHTTGRRIQFNGLTLLKGEEIWINLDPTNLIMRSSWKDRGSVWRYMNAGSDVGDWYIKPGKNSIGVFIPEGYDIATTRAFVQWIPKFWSLDGAVYE